ncbi:glycosyltransferase family 9 protein [Amantichitinum ursilacus]|uniref:ADP-heptose:LPS heptosyl transferase I n=1 Tax=Amantichitinum ursilacus TaxID=857265 RepID=A0A0N0XLG9_9NEIS|nr:glycosyltransferase family 9 protein [Amantichitinum ursilacus]KPC55467.1 ADP-heptose:LPS heptosyl transferase I [Amantichitinum ursilacus]
MKIAIFSHTHIGTLICNWPLFAAVRKRYPQAEITAFLAWRNRELAPYLLHLCDHVVVMPDFVGKKKYLAVLRYGWGYRKQFDLVVCGLEPRKVDHILFGVLGAPTIAYVEDNWHGRLISQPVKFDIPAMRQMRHAQYILRVFEPDAVVDPSRFPRFDDVRRVFRIPPSALTRTQPRQPDEPVRLLISATNNRADARMDTARLISVIGALAEQIPLQVFVCWLGQDQPKAVQLAAAMPVPAEVLDTPSLGEFMAALSDMDLVLVGDGGIMHMAAALDIPQVVVFGSTLVTEWAPMSERAVCLRDERGVNHIAESDIVTALLRQLHAT